MLSDSEYKIFAGSSGKKFARNICAYMGVELGNSEVITFSDGNIMVKINESVRKKDIYLIQSIALNPNEEFVEILFWIDAFKRASAATVNVIMPYFSYAKGDRKDDIRASVRARVCADMIEHAGADSIMVMDLHSPQIQGFFKNPLEHLYAFPLLSEYIKNLNIEDIVIVSPDIGSVKRARRYSNYLNTPLAIGDKIRSGYDENAEILNIVGDVKNKNVVIIDDFSLSGGTLVEISKALNDMGAKRIVGVLSHILLTKDGVERINGSAIDLLISTDTVDNRFIFNSNKIKIVSAAPIFGEAILRIQRGESISQLLNKIPAKALNFKAVE